jgi:hypothetical protein
MGGNCRAKGVLAYKKPGDSFIGLFLLLSTLFVLLAGCGGSASTTETLATQSQDAGSGVAASQAPASKAEPEEVDVTGPAPKLSLEKTTHDFGEVGPGTARTVQFKFKNAGDAPLIISQVKTCCGVRARGVKNGQKYAPGQGATLELDCTFGTTPGAMRRNIYLHTNDPNQKVATIAFKAKIVRRIECKPERLRLFLNQENAGCGDIKLTSLDGRPFSITRLRSTANAITADIDPAVEATEFVLKPQAEMQKLERNLRGRISIDVTHPECKSVWVLYDVLPEFTINQSRYTLFGLKANQPVQRVIWIISNYRSEFEIESAKSQNGIIKVLEQKKVGNRYQLTVEITPPPAEGERPFLADVLEVQIKDGTLLSIPFRGFY